MQQIKDIPVKELRPGIMARLVHGNLCSLSVVEIKKGTVMDEHQHPHEQITYLISGQLDMVIAGEKYSFTPGMVHVIPSNAPHSAYAVTDIEVIDIFSPVREDYK
ncbi:MAG TPA: cupin domain-containing protein [Chitinophagaceae bacterium]|jgi:quercetin dioxygenase-like cupin family protein|nr:cupin domain-containing protein [Chitinophagaceae bacterium]